MHGETIKFTTDLVHLKQRYEESIKLELT